jgi:hypothetical protein
MSSNRVDMEFEIQSQLNDIANTNRPFVKHNEFLIRDVKPVLFANVLDNIIRTGKVLKLKIDYDTFYCDFATYAPIFSAFIASNYLARPIGEVFEAAVKFRVATEGNENIDNFLDILPNIEVLTHLGIIVDENLLMVLQSRVKISEHSVNVIADILNI